MRGTMKRNLGKTLGVIIGLICLMVGYLPSRASADTSYLTFGPTTLSTTSGAGSTAVVFGLSGQATCSWYANGSGSLVAEVSQDGTTWTATNIIIAGTASVVTSVSAPVLATASVSVFKYFRIRMTATGPSTVVGACGQGGPYAITGGGGGGGGVTSVTASGPLSSSGGTTPNITITSAPTFANVTVSALTSGQCVSAGTAGILQGFTCNVGTVTGVTGTSPIVSSGGATPAISCPTCTVGGVTTVTASSPIVSSGGATPNITCPTCGAGTVTSVTGTSPIVSSGGATPAVSCPTCTVGGVTAVTGTSPIVSSGGATPAVSCATCVTNVTASGNLSSSGGTTPAISETASPTYTNVTVSSLTSGNCMQAGAAGLLTTVGGPCQAVTTTTATFVIPAIGSTVVVAVTAGNPYAVFDTALISDGTHSMAGLITVSTNTSMTIRNDAVIAGAVGNTMGSGSPVFSGGVTTFTGGTPAYDQSGTTITGFHVVQASPTSLSTSGATVCGPFTGYCATISLTGAAQFTSGGDASNQPSFTCGDGWIFGGGNYYFDMNGATGSRIEYAVHINQPNTIYVGSNIGAGLSNFPFALTCMGS
jgi:hypothetical protein